MRIPKLPIGKQNLIIKKGRTKMAQGASMLKGWDKQKTARIETAFNTPVLCITLRKAA